MDVLFSVVDIGWRESKEMGQCSTLPILTISTSRIPISSTTYFYS